MRAWAEKLDADARAFFGGVAQINDAAFLLFLCGGVDENEFGAEFERLIQIKQAAVSVDHDRLALRAEFPAFQVLPLCLHGDPCEDAGTAPLARGLRFWHRHEYRAMRPAESQLCKHGWCPKKQLVKGPLISPRLA